MNQSRVQKISIHDCTFNYSLKNEREGDDFNLIILNKPIIRGRISPKIPPTYAGSSKIS